MVNDSREISSSNLGPEIKATFAGEVLQSSSSSSSSSSSERNPRSVFACRAVSIAALEEALRNGKQDLAAVEILPLETVHTSSLEGGS
ncbi:uncharacterized protein L3040_002828 [Drepanopeziza brunnea f. sp. 'multigermtubi']|uniref:uncharacterized protein n=1 Tax=Drepanopeziza brunnea f. sp. 'multigermtubi' TaxID=698441 RepID=UPI0023A33AED|nr:hypothetical protein L3040_002828 [Drepanopeziza brunnea f. sp. 'multigermtubi']